MPIIASARSGGNFQPVSEGVHVATCISIVDLGDQYSELYDKTQRKVMLTWEVADDVVEVDGLEKPRVISKEYTLSLSEKASLRAHLEAWRGKAFKLDELEGFDLRNVLGKSCQMQIVHIEKNGSTYANIKSIMALPKGMAAVPAAGNLTYFALDDPGCLEVLDKLPKWIQDKIIKSSTYKALIETQSDPNSGDLDNDSADLPF